MIALTAPRAESTILRFPTLAERRGDINPSAPITLADYHRSVLLPDLADTVHGVRPRSLDSDRNALNHWKHHTGDPPLRDVTDAHLDLLEKGMAAKGCQPPTINKVWRELKAMFVAAVEDGFLQLVPIPAQRRRGRRIRGQLVKESPKRQRPVLTADEVTRLWRACRFATYPQNVQFPAPKLHRVSIVLYWFYGPRTLDNFGLRWKEDILWRQLLVSFEAMKTSKLQGLPLHPLVAEHLKSIKGHSDRVFPGFNTPGCRFKTGKWKSGFQTTWRREILANANLELPATYRHFRERVVTEFNDLGHNLGDWITAHHIPGVGPQNYDLPTRQIREAMLAAPFPKCFEEIG